MVDLEADTRKKQTPGREHEDQKPASAKPATSQHPVEQLIQKQTGVKQQPTAVIKQQPSQSQEGSQKPPQKGAQPNFLEKYEFKKLTHFEKMQQERGHQTEKSEPELETDFLDNPENGFEDDKDFWEVNKLGLGIN